MSRFIKLLNGVVVDIDRLQLIVRQELNEYGLVIEGCPMMPKCSGDDVDALLILLHVEEIKEPRPVISTQ